MQYVFVMPNGKEIYMEKAYFDRHMPSSDIKYGKGIVSGEGHLSADDIDKMFSRHSRKVKTIFDNAKYVYFEHQARDGLGLIETRRDLRWSRLTKEEGKQATRDMFSKIRAYSLGMCAVAA